MRKEKKVIGMGVVCLDYIVTPEHGFPKPDSKVRTDKAYIYGGGNIGEILS